MTPPHCSNVAGANIYNYRNPLYPRYAIDTFATPGTSTLFTDLSYSVEGTTAGMRWRHLPSVTAQDYLVNPCTATRCFADTPAYDVFDLYFSTQVTQMVTLRGGVDNLFDRDPPIVRGVPCFTDPQNYDVIGRRYYLSASVEF